MMTNDSKHLRTPVAYLLFNFCKMSSNSSVLSSPLCDGDFLLSVGTNVHL